MIQIKRQHEAFLVTISTPKSFVYFRFLLLSMVGAESLHFSISSIGPQIMISPSMNDIKAKRETN